MAKVITLPTYTDARGSLTVIENVLPFEVKRFYYIHGVKDAKTVRAGHRHKKNHQALICLSGSCSVYCNNGKQEQTFVLDTANKCLDLPPEDWHTMQDFTSDCVILVLASEFYDVDDYIDEKYQ